MPKHAAAEFLTIAGAASALAGAYKVGEFAHRLKRLHEVGPGNSVFVRLIHRVRRDLDETQRLLSLPPIKAQLQQNREKTEWIYGVVKDTRLALEGIEPHTERVDSDVRDGRHVGIRHRLRWLLDEREKLGTRYLELSTAHLALLQVLGYLAGLEPRGRKGGERHYEERVDVEAERRGPETVEERWVEESAPRRVEERFVTEDTEFRGPGRFQNQQVYEEARYRGPERVEERYVEEERDYRGPERVEERYVEKERDYRGPGRVEERYHEERGPRRVDEHFVQEGPRRVAERHIEERGQRGGPRRVDERYIEEDRAYDGPRDPYFDRYRATHPRVVGDPGFGDVEITNIREVPQSLERDVWIEEKVDNSIDRYGNKMLPEHLQYYQRRSRL